MTGKRVLVVYYSRGGTTRRAAEAVRDALDCDIDEIRVRVDRRGLVGIIRSAVDAVLRRRSQIEPTAKDPADYDLVIVGTPVWGFSVSGPVRAYLSRQSDRLPDDVAFFCTRIRLGGAPALRRMEKLAGKQPRATLAFLGAQVRRGDTSQAVARFVESL